ncbi:uncharacterized protein RJT20DRAFT_16485 [Scheffersomyces xylosifermentans]|uniref:uncharacterized protein n=1 Tax=Scheffersomyces xylosifermentans TaxID=1304137 RepID=UPI00315DAF3A
MSYNGIGLQTARGSGTSGYVQKSLASTDDESKKNASHYEKRKIQKDKLNAKKKDIDIDAKRLGAKIEIIDHNKSREIEVKCIELREELEEEDVEEDIIEKRVKDLRSKLQRERYESATSRSLKNSSDENRNKNKKTEPDDEEKPGYNYIPRYRKDERTRRR